MRAVTAFDEIVLVGSRATSVMIVNSLQDDSWGRRVQVRAVLDELENGHLHPTLGVPVVSRRQRLAQYGDVPVLLAIAAPGLRRRMSTNLAAEGATFATAVDMASSRVDSRTQAGPGTVCAPHTRIGPNVRTGAGALVMATMVAHDVEIGDYCTLGPHSMVLGHVHVGDGTIVAAGAVIASGTARRPLRIGAGAVIGVGAVVVGDVAPGARMIGNPAMPLRHWVKVRRLLNAP